MYNVVASALTLTLFTASASASEDPYAPYTELFFQLAALDFKADLGAAQKAATVLEQAYPGISARLAKARELSLKRWGWSANFDELAKAEILPPALVSALAIPAAESPRVSAGLMHTYGYLFSQLQTAYGKKGKRWIESRIDERLGLPRGTFGPAPVRGGEFLSLLTETLDRLARTSAHLEERVITQLGAAPAIERSVLTFLTPLAPLADYATTDQWLLSYGFRTASPTDAPVKNTQITWITAFPVTDAFATDIKSRCTSGAPFQTRYNWMLLASERITSSRCVGFFTP